MADADTEFSGYAHRLHMVIILNTAGLWTDRLVARENAGMADDKGPAIASETFRVEGHCCGIRIPALMDQSSAGLQFAMSPEVRAELLRAGIQPAAGPQDSRRSDEVPEPRADRTPCGSAG